MSAQFTEQRLQELLRKAESFSDDELEKLIEGFDRNDLTLTEFKQSLAKGYRAILKKRKGE